MGNPTDDTITVAPPTTLEHALPPAVLLGVAGGCLVIEQLILALAWQSHYGWWALSIAPVLGVALPLYILCRTIDLRIAAALRLRRPRTTEVIGSILVALGTLAPVHAASRVLGRWVQPPDELMDLYAGLLPTNHLTLVAGIAGVVILAPLAEELLFRCLVLRGLGRWVSMPIAVAASAVAFGAAHGSMWLFAPVVVLGLFLGALAWHTGAVTTAWIAHATFNAVAYAELCITHDVATDVVAQWATRPPIAVGLWIALALGWWLVSRPAGKAATALAAAPVPAPGAADRTTDAPASDAEDHL